MSEKTYMQKAVDISIAPENCEGDNWTDLINLCDEADKYIAELKAELDKAEGIGLHLISKLEAENEQAKDKIASLRKQYDDISLANETSRNLLELSQGNYKQLKAENERLDILYKSYQRRADGALEAIKDLGKQRDALRTDLERIAEHPCTMAIAKEMANQALKGGG